MSRYDDEPFLLWFTRPTPTWLELSAAARGVAISVAMEIDGRKGGGIPLRKGLSSLSTLVRIPWETLEPAIAELIAAGKLVWDGASFTLFDPEFADRKRKTSRERMQEKRARDRPASEPPPKCDARDVTSVTDPSCDARDVTSSLVSSSLISDLEIPEEIPSARERRFEPGTATGVEAVSAFECAVAEATSKPYALPRAPFHVQDLCQLLNVHGPPGGLRASLAWLGAAVTDWVAATEARFAAGWTPAKLLAWLNAGRPDKREADRERAAPRLIDVRPAPYHAPTQCPSPEERAPPEVAAAAAGKLARLFA